MLFEIQCIVSLNLTSANLNIGKITKNDPTKKPKQQLKIRATLSCKSCNALIPCEWCTLSSHSTGAISLIFNPLAPPIYYSEMTGKPDISRRPDSTAATISYIHPKHSFIAHRHQLSNS